jgi:hypothetical protein
MPPTAPSPVVPAFVPSDPTAPTAVVADGDAIEPDAPGAVVADGDVIEPDAPTAVVEDGDVIEPDAPSAVVPGGVVITPAAPRVIIPGGVWSPLSESPYLFVNSAEGMLDSGGQSANYLSWVATLTNQGRGSNAAQGSSSRQGFYLPHTGTNYLHLSGTNSGAYTSSDVPTITGDITIEWMGLLPSYATGSVMTLVNRWRNSDTASNVYKFSITATGYLRFYWTPDGETDYYSESTIPIAIPDGVAGGLRVIREAATGKVRFYQRTGKTWEQLGAEVAGDSGEMSSADGLWLWTGCEGSLGSEFVRGQVRWMRVWASAKPDENAPVYQADIENAAANGANLQSASGHTVVLYGTMVRYSLVSLDGVDDGYNGTLGGTINGGRMFAVVNASSGSATGARILSVAAASTHDTNATGAQFSARSSTTTSALQTYYAGGEKMLHANGWSGLYLHEVLLSGTRNFSRRGIIEQAAANSAASITATRYGIGISASQNTGFAKMDLAFLALFPPTMPLTEARRMRRWIKDRFNLP